MSREIRIAIAKKLLVGMVDIQIVKQTHRNTVFEVNDFGDPFDASNGIQLKSAACPEWKLYTNTFFLRGWNFEDDNLSVRIKLDCLLSINEAIHEYNILGGVQG